MRAADLAFDAPDPPPLHADAPHLAGEPGVELLDLEVLDADGGRRRLQLPGERPLTVYLDRLELVTLMTLGAQPQWLVLGYLLNQRVIDGMAELASITVDWSVEAAAVCSRNGLPDLARRTGQRVVTTGCGQGTVYASTLAARDGLRLPDVRSARVDRATLFGLLEAMRQRDSVHRRAGSVHGCALFEGDRLRVFAEDVGRHNAVDTVAGWMAGHGVAGADKVLYGTGRLTSEMVLKAARMGIPILVSRNGVTAMGLRIARELGMTLFGRAFNRHFLCYCGAERFDDRASEAAVAPQVGCRPAESPEEPAHVHRNPAPVPREPPP